jgi:hypothetical protein
MSIQLNNCEKKAYLGRVWKRSHVHKILGMQECTAAQRDKESIDKWYSNYR